MATEDTELAITAAEAGGDVVRARYRGSLTRFEKTGGDFATIADVEAEKAILDVLRAARPDDALLAEECGRTGAERSDRIWLVDPLCGTLNYAARTPLVSVNVALRSGTDVTVGVCADPLAGEVFWADETGGHVRRHGVDEPLAPSAESRLVDVNLDPPYGSDPPFEAVRLLASPAFGARFRARVVSTSLAVAWVADGRRAAYVTAGDLRDSVHFASGIRLCQAAGCVVTGLRGQPLHTGVGGLLVAADRETHAALLAAIEEQFA